MRKRNREQGEKGGSKTATLLLSNFFIFFFICFISPCFFHIYAQEEVKKASIICYADKIEYLQEKSEVIASGNVRAIYKDIELNCRKLRVNTQTKDVYAQGEIVLREGDKELRGENLVYNLDSKKGTLDNGRLFSPIWYGEGKEIEKVSKDGFEIRDGYITTCDPRHPHCTNYKISSQKIEIKLKDRVRAKNVLLWIGKIPIFYLPFYSYSLKNNRPHIRVSGGHSKEWGTFVKTASRFNIDDGEGYFLLDYYERKGVGEGLTYRYSSDLGEGEILTYYIYERDKLKPEGVPAERERYKAEIKHHYQIDKNTDLRLEYHYLRDEDFNKDYFYDLYKQDNQPKSYISLVHSSENYVFTAKARKRVNHFFTVVEKLPELKLEYLDRQIGNSNFYFQSENSFNNFYKRYAHHSQDDEKRWRLDTYNQLSYQIKDLWRWLNVRPYIGTRQTYYNEDRYGQEDIVRGVYYGGLDLSTRFFRIYNAKSNLWGIEINKLKHIIKPKASYNYIREPNLSSERLFQFDSIDSISHQNTLTLSLENILQTKRKRRRFYKNEDLGTVYPLYNVQKGEKKEVVNLLNLRIEADYYLHKEDHHLSDVKIELSLEPYDWLSIDLDSSYDSYARGVSFKERFKKANLEINTRARKWEFTLSNRYEQKESCELSAELNYTLNSLWRVGIYERYDFIKQKNWERGGYSAVHGYRIAHELPCWIVELNYDFKKHITKNNSTLWLIFRIKALPENVFQISKT
ncbi:MAG: hypothetical protein DRP75_01015 [Candidatus Omnitrophota bacterium]|nr:MAG: hypothetical protein DRP75_01015 [Candidatus Omnitrophota bacterium]